MGRMLYFITGNKGKFEEVKAILPEVERLDIDLPEIQEIDAHEVIKAKLQAAFAHRDGVRKRGALSQDLASAFASDAEQKSHRVYSIGTGFMVEDISLCLDCLNGLPGPLIKWFLKAVGNEGLAEITSQFGNDKVTARTMIGYAKSADDIHFFEGVIEGKIVAPRGELGFGWDPIFLPEGYDKTFAEMTLEEKNAISMRRIATNKLKEFLSQ